MNTTNKTLQILSHPKCPAVLLSQHLCSSDDEIRVAVASNPSLNDAQQEQLAGDQSISVLLALLDNSNLSASNKTLLEANLSIALETELNAKKQVAPPKKAAPPKKVAPPKKAAPPKKVGKGILGA